MAGEEKKTEVEFSVDAVLKWVEDNMRTVQYGVYGVGTLAGLLAIRSVRPFKQFTRPSHIPRSFYKKHVQLTGKVTRLEFGDKGAMLVVAHRPLLLSSIRRWESPRGGEGLRVSLEGIRPSPNGVSWLQTLLVGRHISFSVVSPRDKPPSVSAIVRHSDGDVASRLVSLGFATVSEFDPSLDSDKLYRKFYKSLLKLESRAESSRAGMWSDSPFNLLRFIVSKLASQLNRIRPKRLKAIS